MHILRSISRFRRDRRGNVAVIFAIACVPLISAVGCALDYSRATQFKSKLQAAADAASVGSVARTSPAAAAASNMTGDGPIPDGVADANNIFDGNLWPVTTGFTRTSTVTKAGLQLTSNVSFGGDVPVTFLKIMGYDKLTVSGTSNSSASLPPYLDFYLMLDVSGSMGLPSTEAEQTRLAAVNPDNRKLYPGGCTLACHFDTTDTCGDGNQQYSTSNYCLGYQISRISQNGFKNLLGNYTVSGVPKLPSYRISNLPWSLFPNTGHPADPNLPPVSSCPADGTDACIQLRADAVGYAVTQLLVTANNSKIITDQFRVGLYPFIQYLYEYSKLTKNLNGSPTDSSSINYAAANLASQLDTNTNASLGSGGTHIDDALNTLNTNFIKTVGDGSASTNTLPFVFLVTDGAQDNQIKGINGGGWSGSNHATVIPSGPTPASPCKALKDRGINVAVLYIPYQPIQNPNTSFAGNEDGYANSNIPNIPPSLQACASPNFFFTANSPADITDALNKMFKQSLVTAHITN
jgi:Flp pilus assembly protein TadG